MNLKFIYIYRAIFFIILLITGICIQVMAGETTADFKWLFVPTIDDDECTINIENLHNPVINKKCKLFFKPINRVYLYLLLRDSADDFIMIFPDAFETFSKKSYIETEYFIPEDGNWNKFTRQPGRYKLYFLVTKKRMKVLENLINNYQKISKKESQDELDQIKKKDNRTIETGSKKFHFS